MKRALVGSLVVPFVLAGAIWWARDAAWKKMETHFRADFRGFVKSNESHNLSVWGDISSGTGRALKWNGNDFSRSLEKVHLQPSSSRPSPREPLITIVSGPDEARPHAVSFGLTLSEQRDRGWVDASNDWGGDANDIWNRYELTPESCRFLKKRVAQLRALQTPRLK